MLVDEMPRSFVKRNNSYSHCPLKKRPVHVMLAAEDVSSDPIKDEIIVDDVLPEPENLSTKPEDLSRTAVNHKTLSESNIHLLQSNHYNHNNNNNNNNNNNDIKIELKRSPSPLTRSSPSSSPSPISSPSPPSSPLLKSAIKLGITGLIQNQNQNHENDNNNHQNRHHNNHQNLNHQIVQSSHHHHHHHHHHNHNHQNQHRHQSNNNFQLKSSTSQSGVVNPLHPIPKKARVEILQHESGPAISVQVVVGGAGVGVGGGGNSNSAGAGVGTQSHYLGTGVVSSAQSALEPLNLNTPVEPLARYASTPSWASRAAPLFPPHYLPYPSAGFARYPGAPGGQDLYPAYPVPSGYSHTPSSPERGTASSPPHATLPRPVARNYTHWGSPEHCGLSPTGSLGSGSLRSPPPPPVSPEDLSSPGSDSGRSSAGSTSAGPVGGSQKIGDKSGGPRYQCPDCGKSYSTYSGLSKHQQFHCAAAEGQAKKSFSCKYCEKVYVSLGALKMHIRTHTLPCKCHLCGKAFSRPWLLQGHIRTHTGEKPFSCQHCNRAFADRSNLRAHLQTHSDVKKYSCSSCSKTFSRMSLLTKHQEGGCPGVAVPIAYGC